MFLELSKESSLGHQFMLMYTNLWNGLKLHMWSWPQWSLCMKMSSEFIYLHISVLFFSFSAYFSRISLPHSLAPVKYLLVSSQEITSLTLLRRSFISRVTGLQKNLSPLRTPFMAVFRFLKVPTSSGGVKHPLNLAPKQSSKSFSWALQYNHNCQISHGSPKKKN